MLFPLLVLYYRLGNEKKAKEYLKKVNKVNNNLGKLFKGEDLVSDETPTRYYSHVNFSKIYMYLEGFGFLMDSVPNIDEFVIKNSK